MPEAQVNFFCPEQRAAFMRRPCEGFWAKIAEAREKWPNHQFHFPLNQCVDCKGDKLVPPEQEEKAVVEAEKGKMVRTQILDAMDRMIPTVGSSVTKKDLATALNIPVANLAFHLAKLHNSGLVKITGPGDGYPDQISWPTPPGETLPDKAVDVIQKDDLAETVIQPYDEEVVVTRKASDIVQVRPEVLAQRIAEGKVHPAVEHSTPSHDKMDHPALEHIDLEQSGVRLCKNNDGRPAHKTSPYCLECCQENLKRNQVKGKERPKNDPTASDLNPTERLFNWTLETLPPFDPTWEHEIWERWNIVWGNLWDISRDLDGVERDGPVTGVMEDIYGELREIKEKIGTTRTASAVNP